MQPTAPRAGNSYYRSVEPRRDRETEQTQGRQGAALDTDHDIVHPTLDAVVAMLISKENETTFKKTVGSLGDRARAVMLNASVKLESRNRRFRASAVIAGVSDGMTTLVSAMHSLYVCAGLADPPPDPAELVEGFSQLDIVYGDRMEFNKAPDRTAAISEVRPVIVDEANPWAYDVILVTSDDADLANFAMTYGIYVGDERPTDPLLLTNPAMYLNKSGSKFIQIGYGDASEVAEDGRTKMPKTPGSNTAGNLQYRGCSPLAAAPATVYGQRTDNPTEYNEYTDAIQLDASTESSSAPGDSGGPLFMVSGKSGPERVDLIGTTLGADMDTAKRPCPPAGQLRVNNAATSLAYCYQENLLPNAKAPA